MQPAVRIRIDAQPIRCAEELDWLYRLEAGAVASFTGLVRGESEQVSALHLEHYEPMTESGIRATIAAAHRRWPLLGVSLAHRIGRITPGQTIVVVGTAATHRQQAQTACEYLVDHLKTQAALWKRECRNGTWSWLKPKQTDADRWSRWRQS